MPSLNLQRKFVTIQQILPVPLAATTEWQLGDFFQ
jgi:hypothetical protein